MGNRLKILGVLYPDQLEKLDKQNRKEYIAIETSNAPIQNFIVPVSDNFVINSGTAPQTPTASGCLLSVCGTSPGVCIPAFSVTGGYGFKGMPLDMSIALYAAGTIPGNATAFAGPSISGSNPRNGTNINSFVSGDGSIYNESLYSEIVSGGYTFQNTDVEADLSFITCEAYNNYTSAQTANFQGYGVVSPAVIHAGDGATELDASHCGTLSSFIGAYRSEASCLAGNYTLGGVVYSGSYLTWSVF